MDKCNSLKIIDILKKNYIEEDIKNELHKNDNLKGHIIINKNIKKEVFVNNNNDIHVIILYNAEECFNEYQYCNNFDTHNYSDDVFSTPKSFIDESLIDVQLDSISSDEQSDIISSTDSYISDANTSQYNQNNNMYKSNINLLYTHENDVKDIITRIINLDSRRNIKKRRCCNCNIL